jgi:hypothetical protein
MAKSLGDTGQVWVPEVQADENARLARMMPTNRNRMRAGCPPALGMSERRYR